MDHHATRRGHSNLLPINNHTIDADPYLGQYDAYNFIPFGAAMLSIHVQALCEISERMQMTLMKISVNCVERVSISDRSVPGVTIINESSLADFETQSSLPLLSYTTMLSLANILSRPCTSIYTASLLVAGRSIHSSSTRREEKSSQPQTPATDHIELTSVRPPLETGPSMLS